MALSKILPASQEQFAGARNLIINGAMQVAQRGTSGTSNGYNSVDRFRAVAGATDQLAVTYSQDSDAPDGFSNSFKADVTTSETTLDADEQLFIEQRIEAQNLQHLSFGASSAKSITLSFWVKCSETGVATIMLYQPDDGRSYCTQYTISSANTWEYKTITASGDTVGVIDNNNDRGLQVRFALAAGSNYTSGTKDTWVSYASSNEAVGQTVDVATAGGNFAITGIQLEVGETATPFEHRSYGDELVRCQRYLQVFVPDGQDFTSFASAIGTTETNRFFCPITLSGGGMRTDPTLSFSAVGDFRTTNVFTNNHSCTSISIGYNNPKIPNLSVYSGGSGDSVSRMFGFGSNTSAYMRFDAEL